LGTKAPKFHTNKIYALTVVLSSTKSGKMAETTARHMISAGQQHLASIQLGRVKEVLSGIALY